MGLKPDEVGQSEAFYRFIVDELRPAIAALYPVDPANQTLYGHSFGGLFTLGVLFNHPEAFRSYVASSPSIWWNGRSVLRGEAAFTHAVEAKRVAPRILLMVGGREQIVLSDEPLPPGMTKEMAEKLTAEARMVDNMRELSTRLAGLKGGPDFTVESQVIDNEDHISVIPASIGRAVTFAGMIKSRP
jgi:hypothetical protein